MNAAGEARGLVDVLRRNWTWVLLLPFYTVRWICRVVAKVFASRTLSSGEEEHRRRIASGRARFFVVVLLAGAEGCTGTPYDRGRQTLTGLEQAVRVAAVALNETDAREQAAIPGKARAKCSGDADPGCVEREGRSILREYLKRYDAARRVIGDVHAALAGAAAVLIAAELAQRAEGVTEIVAGLAPLARDLAAALAGVGIAPPSTSGGP